MKKPTVEWMLRQALQFINQIPMHRITEELDSYQLAVLIERYLKTYHKEK